MGLKQVTGSSLFQNNADIIEPLNFPILKNFFLNSTNKSFTD